MKQLNVLSLGAGVQSSTLALMSSFDCAIFADTGAEPAGVYRWLDWLEPKLSYPVYRVTAGSLEESELKVRRSQKSGRLYMKGSIPAFVRKADGDVGMMGRKCTADFKIEPVTRKLRELLGIKRAPRDRTQILVRLALGISLDEVERMKPSRYPWVEHYWPLIDSRMTREDCLIWMFANGYPEPPRSACRFCPFHSDAEWGRLKQEEPDEFEKAARFEESLQETARKQEVLKGVPFLHASGQPLRSIDFSASTEHPGKSAFGNECEGLCGI